MKIRNHLLLLLLFIVFLFVAIVFFDRFITGFSFSDLSFFKSEKHSAFTIAEEIGDLYQLNTSEYRVKLIFPFDFAEREFNWWIVKEAFEMGYALDEKMDDEMAIYQSCLNAGFDPAVNTYEFIVLTAVVKAGINISGTVFENPSLFENQIIDEYISIEESADDKKIISLCIPKVEVTDYYIEDRKPDSDNFPDAKLTPVQWRDLVKFLNPLIQEKVIQLGILKNAENNSRELIERILIDGGFSEVIFIGQEL